MTKGLLHIQKGVPIGVLLEQEWQNEGEIEGSDTSVPLKKKEVEARRLRVADLILKGFQYHQIAQELGISERTIKRDAFELRKGNVRASQKFISEFDLDYFFSLKLEEIRMRRRALWEIIDGTGRAGQKVRAVMALGDLNAEEERALNKLGIETSRVSPEKIAGQRIVFVEDSPPDDKVVVYRGYPPEESKKK